MPKINATKASMRRRLLMQVRALGKTLLDSMLADEVLDNDPEVMTDCFPGGLGFPPIGLDTDFGHVPDLGARLNVARAALFKRVRERAQQQEDPGGLPARKTGFREYPMGLVPAYTSTMERFRELIKVREEESGRKVVYLDPTEATQELLSVLKGQVSEPAMVSAGSCITVTGRPQVLFRPELVSIEAELAPHFAVVDIRIGKNSQFVSSAEILAEEFVPGRSRRMKFDTCQISMDVSVVLRNRTDKPQRCPYVTLYGPAVE